MNFSLSPKISYQIYDDFSILMDHTTGNDYQMNRYAGLLIEKVNEGEINYSEDELDFLYQLEELGIVEKPGFTPDLHETESSERNDHENSEVFEDLNKYAAQKLIPVSAIVELTYRCNLSCVHCYIDKNNIFPEKELSKKELISFIDQFREMGGLVLILTGGDPLLHPNFKTVFDYARKKHIAVSVMSSAWNADNELLEHLASKGLLAFQASIYGADSSLHDSFTKVHGSFTKTIDALRKLKTLGVHVQAAVSITTHNISSFDKIITFLNKEQILFNINYHMLSKRDGDTSPLSLQISEKELFECLKIQGIKNTARLKNISDDDPPCNAGRSLFSLDPYGNIYPCLEIRRPAGSLKEKRLQKIWRNAKVLNTVRSLKFRDLKKCPTCELKNYCDRCSGSSLREHLDITDHSSFDCMYATCRSRILKINRENACKDESKDL